MKTITDNVISVAAVFFLKSGGKTDTVGRFKKALAKSWQFLCPNTGFCEGTIPKSMLLPQFRTSKGDEGVKTIRYPLFLPDIALADLFLHQRMMSELAGV